MKTSQSYRYIVLLAACALFSIAIAPGRAVSAINSADRAVRIARQARARIEISSQEVKGSSDKLFSEFAQRTAELQKLLDARKSIADMGLLRKNDPLGDARRSHINGKILMEIGTLKEACDKNFTVLMASLEDFDRAVARSIADSQATRSLNSNYEIGLRQYVNKEKSRFETAVHAAEESLMNFQDGKDDDPAEVKRLRAAYQRAKKRLKMIEQRRQVYEARLRVATMNQKISAMIRQKIQHDGGDLSGRFRSVMGELYNCFAKIVPIAESGGTGKAEVFANLGFNNIDEFRKTLDIVDGATAKLGTVLDSMVDDVLSGLGKIQMVDDGQGTGGELSVEEEMAFLRRQRENW